MRLTLRHIPLLLILSAGSVLADEPRWGFLGDDDSLASTFNDAKNVVLVCVYETELRDVKPPFAEVVHFATVIESQKGELKMGEKIQIGFKTDSLPVDEEEQQDFVQKANTSSKGSLKFAFLHGEEAGVHFCDFLDVPNYTKEMHEFLRLMQLRHQTPQTLKTDPESKPEDGEKPQPE